MANGELIEKVAGELDDVAVRVEEVADATRLLTGREVGFFTVGLGIGTAIGFVVASRIVEKKVRTKYSKIAADEISEMRDHYLKKTMAAETKPPIDEVIKERYSEVEQRAIDETNAKFPSDDVEVVEEKTTVNVFETVAPENGWDYAIEIRNRQPDVPFIIHIDEFTQNEPEHDQLTYTYYEQDDVLADQQENTIDDMDAVIGLGNLGRWGHGSNDENIVYIRNLEMECDFEVVRDRGSFAEETRKSIRHSYDRRRRIQRGFDDD